MPFPHHPQTLSLVGGVVAAFILVSACTSADPQQGPEIIAEYKGGTISAERYAEWLEHRGQAGDSAINPQWVAGIAVQETLASEALRLGLAEDPETRIALAMAEATVLEKALRQQLSDSVRIQAEVIEQAVEANRANFTGVPRRVKLHNIFKRVLADSDDTERERLRRSLETIRDDLLAGADFAEVARRESDSQSRYKGGKMALIAPGELAPEVEAVIFAMQPGELSSIFENQAGFTLLRCDGFVEAREPSEQEIRDQVLKNLRHEAFDQLIADLEQRLLAGLWMDVATLHTDDGEKTAMTLDSGISLTSEAAWLAMASFGVRAHDTRFNDTKLGEMIRDVAWLLASAEEAKRRHIDQKALVATKLSLQRQDMLAAAALERRVSARFEAITETATRELYDADPTAFMLEDQLQLQVLRRRVGPEELGDVYYSLEAVAEEIAAGRLDLKTAAVEYSDHPSAARGGYIGWQYRQQLAGLGQSVFSAVLALADGETSGLVQQPDGLTRGSTLWIICRLGTRPPRAMTFSEARSRLESKLENQQKRRLDAEITSEIGQSLGFRLVDNRR